MADEKPKVAKPKPTLATWGGPNPPAVAQQPVAPKVPPEVPPASAVESSAPASPLIAPAAPKPTAPAETAIVAESPAGTTEVVDDPTHLPSRSPTPPAAGVGGGGADSDDGVPRFLRLADRFVIPAMAASAVVCLGMGVVAFRLRSEKADQTASVALNAQSAANNARDAVDGLRQAQVDLATRLDTLQRALQSVSARTASQVSSPAAAAIVAPTVPAQSRITTAPVPTQPVPHTPAP